MSLLETIKTVLMTTSWRRKKLGESFEFSIDEKVRRKEQLNHVCEGCGKKFKAEQLSAHHIISVSNAIDSNLAATMISSVANMKILCDSCHKKADREQKKKEAKEKKIKKWW